MAKTLWTSSGGPADGTGGTAYTQNATYYSVAANGGLVAQTTANEAFAKITQRAAGTARSLLVNVSANALADDSTFRTRLNGANGGMSVTITAGTTGQFSDSSGSDVIASGDTYNYQIVVPLDDPGFTFVANVASVTFAATTSTVIRYAAVDFSDLSSGSTYYIGMANCSTSGSGHTTEAWHSFDTNAAATYQNLYVYVSVNSGATATSVFLRQNGADTTVTVSCTGATTGSFEDAFATTGHSVTTAANDDMNYSIVSNNQAAFNIEIISIEATSTDSTSHSIIDVDTALGSVGAGLTRYACVGGGGFMNGTEAVMKNKMAFAATTSNLTIYVVTDTITA